MPWVLLLTVGALAYALRSKYPSGQGPRDVLPLGFTGAPSKVQTGNAPSGRTYTVESWPANGAGETFHLALPVRSDAYASWVVTGSARKLFRSFGAPAELAAMKQDFNL